MILESNYKFDKLIWKFIAIGAAVFLFPLIVFSAEPYRIGPEDRLEIRFWQDNTLDAEVKVTLDGNITLDIIGQIQAAGMTTAELERAIVRQMSRYNKAISQTVVRVVEYNSLKVFVSGQVVNPGKYTFEEIPDLWTIINEAGGATELGDLSRVYIIRGGEDAGDVEIVNVSAMITSGNIDELPEIRIDDTIEIPRNFAGLPTGAISDSPDQKKIFYVIGEVNTPGVQNLDRGLDLLEAIAMAGGPLSSADLKNVSVITKDRLGTQISQVDLNRYSQEASFNRYIIMPEDVIFLPPGDDRAGFLGLGLTDWIAVIGGVSTMILVADRLQLFGLGD
jgi:polysaccharide export outer membrane protein